MIKKWVVSIVMLTLSFLIGANFVYTKHWPYHILRQLGAASVINNIKSNGKDGFFQEMFSDKFIARDLLSSNIKDRKELISAIDAIATPRVDIRNISKYLKLVGSITTKELNQDKLKVSTVSYILDDHEMEVYAYKIHAKDNLNNSMNDCAALVIPGSGSDQALAISNRDTRNYHSGILDPFDSCDIFVLIKPNEDYLAITYDGRKLNEKAYLYHLLGMGSSYSSRYVTDAIALTLELKRNYNRTIVTGLSQGGTAAVVVGIEAQPNLAIAASGIYEIQADLGYGGFNSTLIFPGFQREIFKEWMPEKLRESEVNFLIIGGTNEPGLIGEDYREGWTCSKLAYIPQVNCMSHPGGHIYPSKIVKTFVDGKLNLSNKLKK